MGCGGSKTTVKEGTKKNQVTPKKQTNQHPDHHEADPHPHQDRRDPKGTHNSNTMTHNNNTTTNNLNYYPSPKHTDNPSPSPRHAKSTQSPYPQSKYVAASSYTESVHDDAYPEASHQGYKKRIRTQLIQATRGKDLEALEQAIKKFESNRMEDAGDLTRANERLYFLKQKRDLRDAIRRSNVGVLERTIKDARSCRYANELQPQIEAAERKLEHLRELNKYSHDILAMDQHTISEIHSYHRPPACVHDVMAASYMLLGHQESTLRDWSYLQSMAGKLGKDSLIHQVKDFDSNNVDDRTSKRVREILNYHDPRGGPRGQQRCCHLPRLG
ncbi:uncharacterized protein LOC131950161 [Physella acuta]|uniref:uncharacterized protein LOC131950161 n=1 Tax=Physella acuta TaxID=109671 RepID=UPI0027DB411A|nr:uncharacterized protein LOC131950161 [Physella acuta]